MTPGHRAAEPHEQTSRESRFPGHPKEPMRLAVSVPSRPMVKILDAQNSIKQKEQREYHREVQDYDGDPDISHGIKRRNPTSELTRRRESKHPSPHQASCERRYRRSRPTICWVASALRDSQSGIRCLPGRERNPYSCATRAPLLSFV